MALVFVCPAICRGQAGSDLIRQAIERSLPLLEMASAGSAEQRECFTCHNQGLPILALTEARRREFDIDQENYNRQLDHTFAHLDRNKQQFLDGKGTGGKADTAGYALWALSAGQRKQNETTAAVVEFLLRWQSEDDCWSCTSDRPPSETSDFTTTYVALRGLAEFGTAEQQTRIAARRDSARNWLLAAVPVDNEDHVFRLWALRSAGVQGMPLASAASELIQRQRDDGGWSQLADHESDPYATATALVALQRTGALNAIDPVYERGVRFLLESQLDDGSWHVVSRSKPFQAYFESGFPHGNDQFISVAASSWATLALLLALPEPQAAANAVDSSPPAAEVLAFPGAEGFGAGAKGGRGGKVLLVTNLEDYAPGREPPIPGSLRAACDEKGPRTVVFRVAGTIALKAPLSIREPFLTLAGQTAAGDGICLKDYGVGIRTHDVIVRYLRFRPGDESGKEQDALAVYEAQDVIIDHCSTSWGSDETLSVTGDGCTNVTVQWCLISESLNQSVHRKGAHGYGSLIRANGNVTFHHNIYAHHSSRCPRPGTYGPGSLLLDFRNNVIYDGKGYSAEDPVRMNYVGNYIKSPNGAVFGVGGSATQIYAEGNVLEGERDIRQWDLFRRATDDTRAERPFPVAAVATQPAAESFEALLQSCGAVLPRRDGVDERVIDQVRHGTGKIINSQQDVGGWPELSSAAPPTDADMDGMPDDWERTRGLDPSDAADQSQDRNKDGYTNLEDFLNDTVP
jgi:pectate lyase